jgi:hypothetical protein
MRSVEGEAVADCIPERKGVAAEDATVSIFSL